MYIVITCLKPFPCTRNVKLDPSSKKLGGNAVKFIIYLDPVTDMFLTNLTPGTIPHTQSHICSGLTPGLGLWGKCQLLQRLLGYLDNVL